MLAYKVGGTVRDTLLGRSSADEDHVVVGETPEAMLKRGFKQVGADFPVFVDPKTGGEYALARTERKKGKGYKGFAVFSEPTVTLEEDLLRRDFTINAMAQDQGGRIIDPHHGRRDISLRVLRHVSDAFSEDPLRVLRAARLSAELGFAVAPETLTLMARITESGELDHLVAERVWQEVSRGLLSDRPTVMIEVLRSCGALAKVFPEVDALFGVPQNKRDHPEGCAGRHTLLVVNTAACNWCGIEVRLAALLHDVGKALTPEEKLPHHIGHEQAGAKLVAGICDRMRVPRQVARSVTVATREHGSVHGFASFDAGQAVDFLSRVDAIRNKRQLEVLLSLCDCDHAAHPGRSDFVLHPNRKLVLRCLDAAMNASVSEAGKTSADPAAAVRKVRLKEVEKALAATGD